LGGWGVGSRGPGMTGLVRETREQAVSTVIVTTPSRGAASEEVALPGNVQPYTDAAIFARTAGYLKTRYADIGSHVKAGQNLAEVDQPENAQQPPPAAA